MNTFINALKDKNIPITSSRLAILKVLDEADMHLSVEEIFYRAKKTDKKIGLATVYRTLNLLCDLSLIEKHEFNNQQAVYEKSDAHSDHHHHIIDARSGKIIEFSDDDIDNVLNKIAKKHGYKMLSHKLEIYGEKVK